MKQFFFWCYPWDLEEEGCDLALGRLAGEIGVNALSVAATYHGVTEFRPRRGTGPRTVRHEAGVHFQPSTACYCNTRLRPTAAAWMKSRNPLQRIAQSCEKLSLKLRAQVMGCCNSTLAKRYPMAACVDVFGDPIEAWLCPSNPDVREYLAALVEDLSTNYSAETIELHAADFGDRRYRPSDFEAGVHFDETALKLLNWCFCPACRQRAEDIGVDVQEVSRSVLTYLEPFQCLQGVRHRPYREWVEADNNTSAFHRMRREAVTSLIKTIRRRTNKRLILAVGGDRVNMGAKIETLGEFCDGFLLAPTPQSPQPWPNPAEDAARLAGASDRIEVGALCYPPYAADGPSLVSAVHQASEAGFGAIGFSNYGITPAPCLDWVRQAIRYARRESIS